jgi:U4/U6 small nuclear ribonucleoprotein PRP4
VLPKHRLHILPQVIALRSPQNIITMSIHASRLSQVDNSGLIDLSDIPTSHASEQANAFLSQLDRKRRIAQTIVPTNDAQVRSRLRDIDEPITLFGEGPAERRDRLRELLSIREEIDEAEREDREADGDVSMGGVEGAEGEEQEEEFYTAGTDELLEARREIARFSLPRARRRVQSQKTESGIPLRTHVKFRKQIKEKLGGFELQGSQIAGERPVSITRFSPSGEIIAAGNWGGGIKLLKTETLEEKKTLRGHTDRVGGISWRPGATVAGSGVEEGDLNLASGAADGKVHLWSLNQDTPIGTLAGHSQRVCRVEFHPSGKHIASASEDTTWRLWDVPTQSELLLQEGHSRGVFAVSFSTDGSLLASGGTDSIGRIWDLRTGRTVMILDGHIRPIYALDWGVDGHRVLSGSGDGWVKCWDIRKVTQAGGVGAHKSVVSDLRWFKGIDNPADGHVPEVDEQGGQIPKKSGTFFVSAGFDKEVKVFSADDWGVVTTLRGHTGNVHSVDVSADARWIVSGGYDRTVKIWGRNDGEGL